jgi:hypothetical protein
MGGTLYNYAKIEEKNAGNRNVSEYNLSFFLVANLLCIADMAKDIFHLSF